MECHKEFLLGFEAKVEPRGTKTVVAIKVINGETREALTSAIDIAYLENGKTFVREINELWERAYRFRCPCCDSERPLPLPFMQALVLVGQGVAKATLALENFPRDINLN